MVLTQSGSLNQCQRVQTELEPNEAGSHVKIRVESYDENLGWYTAGALPLPLHQLPLLEQALDQMRTWKRLDEDSDDKIIPFPVA